MDGQGDANIENGKDVFASSQSSKVALVDVLVVPAQASLRAPCDRKGQAKGKDPAQDHDDVVQSDILDDGSAAEESGRHKDGRDGESRNSDGKDGGAPVGDVTVFAARCRHDARENGKRGPERETAEASEANKQDATPIWRSRPRQKEDVSCTTVTVCGSMTTGDSLVPWLPRIGWT